MSSSRMLVCYSSTSSSDDDYDEDGDDFSSKSCKKRKSAIGSSEEDHRVQKKKRSLIGDPERLPLPDTVLEMFRDVEDQCHEDRSQHGGRIRSFQHERGNWASYVYLPYIPDDSFPELLEQLVEATRSGGINLTQVEDFHLSLSQTVVLRHHWIQPFIQSLRTSLSQSPRSLSGSFDYFYSFPTLTLVLKLCVNTFITNRHVCLAEGLQVYSNSEKTRTFLGVEVSSGHAQLLELVQVIDRTMEEFGLPTFYQNPSFHISIAWCVGDRIEQLRNISTSILQTVVEQTEEGVFPLRIKYEELRCKSGNKVFCFPLR
ncbi:U6 snRNA phosphodiesterase 1 isoform X1 [Denticeps clupeoides]|uniref:U6 snRNA phosphodiesterase 1 isoform X1 n=1 Tax=Denticeps clupeoides TaxID=299321 RepID=UPI0010A32F7C|nr:U6 snRNA phosphodiesterase isoform X1 [Denticeps clupeoides]